MSAQAASFGKCSLIRTPVAMVSIGLNSPRNSVGASGLGSNVSMWLGPPPSVIRIALVALRAGDFARFRQSQVAGQIEP